MTLLLLHMKYPRCTWHVTISAYINDMVVSTWKYTICSLCMLWLVHDDYRTWGLYTKCTICMLRLIHDDYRTCGLYTKCTICMLRLVHNDYICTIAWYGTVTIIFLIVTVNMEYRIIVLYCSRLGFLDFDRFCWIWFFSFLLLIAVGFFAWVRFKVETQGWKVGVGECAVI